MSLWRRALGILLLVLGFLALITPLTPGSWLIFVGAEILGIEFLCAQNVQAFLERQVAWLMPLICIAAPLIAGAVGSLFTISQVSTWYATLAQPWWTPPSWVFAPVWTTLYLLMGIAALLVWRARKPSRRFALEIFFLHLAVNALWSIVFFGLHAPAYALAIIAMLWLLIVLLVTLFARQSRAAAWLLVPYLLWVSYAATLNLGIVLLN